MNGSPTSDSSQASANAAEQQRALPHLPAGIAAFLATFAAGLALLPVQAHGAWALAVAAAAASAAGVFAKRRILCKSVPRSDARTT